MRMQKRVREEYKTRLRMFLCGMPIKCGRLTRAPGDTGDRRLTHIDIGAQVSQLNGNLR